MGGESAVGAPPSKLSSGGQVYVHTEDCGRYQEKKRLERGQRQGRHNRRGRAARVSKSRVMVTEKDESKRNPDREGSDQSASLFLARSIGMPGDPT